MPEKQFPGESDTARYELLQRLLLRMFSLMKNVQRDASVIKPSLSPPQARLVLIISRYSDSGISVKELARLTSVTPGAITQFINTLVDKKLITRETDPADRRSIKIKLTPSARNEIHQFKNVLFNFAAKKFDALNTDELKEITRIMAKVNPEIIPKEEMF